VSNDGQTTDDEIPNAGFVEPLHNGFDAALLHDRFAPPP
jgi:hypothetical protein